MGRRELMRIYCGNGGRGFDCRDCDVKAVYEEKQKCKYLKSSPRKHKFIMKMYEEEFGEFKED